MPPMVDNDRQMVLFSRDQIRKALSGIGVRQVRLASGLVLFTYLVSHFLNHALGNISVEALTEGVHYHTLFWQFLPVAIILYTAVLVHFSLGIWALYQRRQFAWRTIELLQLLLGLSIPLLIASHIIGARLGETLFGHEKLYPQELYAFWVARPIRAWQMSIVLVIAWMHGCIGLHFWLRMKAFYAKLAPYLLGAVVLARGARLLIERRGGMIALSYGNGKTIRVPKGLSVLEASLRYNVPHASVCGGRARCSTCRIRIIGDCSSLPEPSPREAFVLARVGTSDPSIRLACQLRPTADLSFFQLFLPNTSTANEHASNPTRIGQERYLVSLFVDMRGSTRLAEKMLPFDTVFVVNRFLSAVAQAVTESGGRPNQFVGDGMLALFGLASSAQAACRQALKAAALIAKNVDDVNQFLSHDLREPIRFGIGIHGGEVIVGDIGYRDHMVFTALGDAVNVAARLQEMTKSLSCQAIVSEEVLLTANLAANDLQK